MVGNLHRAGRHVLLAGGQGGEHGRHQVVGLHPLDRGRGLAAAPHPQHRPRRVLGPPPCRRPRRRAWIGGGLWPPPRIRSTVSDVFRFHRQRDWNNGEVSTACRSTCSTVAEARNFGTRSSGKLCCGPSDSKIALSLAAACSSKSNVTQN